MVLRYDALINEIESKISTDSIKYQGESIWPLIRVMILYQGLGAQASSSSDNNDNFLQRKSWKAKAGDILLSYQLYQQQKAQYIAFLEQEKKVIQGDIQGNAILKKTDFLFLHYQSHRNQLYQGKYCNIFLHPLLDEIEKNFSCLSLEVDENPSSLKMPRYSSSFLIGGKIKKAELKLAKANVRSKIRDFFIPFKQKKIEGFNELKALMPNELKSTIFKNSSYIIKQFEYVKAYSKVFEALLDEVRPKVMLQASFYHLMGLAMNRACALRNVRSVDVQHGILEPMAYAGYRKYGTANFTMLPSFFWLWDKDSENVIKQWSATQNNYVVGGNVWLNKKMDNMPVYDTSLSILKELRLKYKVLVLFTVQPNEFSALPQFLFQIIKQLTDVMWLIRWHPRNTPVDKENFISDLKSAGCENFSVDGPSELPLSIVVPLIDFHVTKFSSVVFDAARYNVPTIFIDEYAKDIYSKEYPVLWNSGIVQLATDSKVFERVLKDKNLKRTFDSSTYFGDSNYQSAIQKMLRA